MNITWMGTATFAVESKGQRILFDPYMELQGGDVPGDLDKLKTYDTVFVTHCHFDHLSLMPELLEDKNATLFCTGQCCETLEGFLDDCSNIVQVEAGRSYRLTLPRDDKTASASDGSITIDVIQGRHIDFKLKYAPQTLSLRRMLRYAPNLPYLVWANKTFRENGEIVAYQIHAEGRRVMILGSLALDDNTEYPHDMDVLVLPYQGNNDLPACAREVLSRLRPRSVVLSHFDNSFPPMSRNVDLRPLRKLMEEEFPLIKVVKPTPFKEIQIL